MEFLGKKNTHNLRYHLFSTIHIKSQSPSIKAQSIVKPGPMQGLSECKQCPRGSFSGEQAIECELCPIGEAQSQEGQQSCETCPPGSFSSQPGGSIKQRSSDVVQSEYPTVKLHKFIYSR